MNKTIKSGDTFTMEITADCNYVVSGQTRGVIGYDYAEKGGVQCVCVVECVDPTVPYKNESVFYGRVISVSKKIDGTAYKLKDRSHANALASVHGFKLNNDGTVSGHTCEFYRGK